MSIPPKSNPRSPPSIHSLLHLLHQSLRIKNLTSTKTLHSLLLRTGLLFTSLHLHTNLILAYATSSPPSLLPPLSNFFISTHKKSSPLHWNAVIAAFCHHHLPFLALHALSLMHKTHLCLDTYALCSALTASTSVETPNFGKPIHSRVLKSGWSSSVYVGTSVVNFYVKFTSIEDAQRAFDEIPIKNTVCINALMAGYAEAMLWMDGLHLLRKMQSLDLEPDDYTISALLRSCAGLSAAELGRQVHAYQIRRMAAANQDIFFQSALIEMYGKCGLIHKARSVFDLGGAGERCCGSMHANQGHKHKGIKPTERQRDVVIWTSMLNAYSRNSMFQEVIEAYNEMLMEGARPDGLVFLAVLSACNHTGHVEHGLEYLESMTRDFGLVPEVEHCSCVVDMLCRRGELERVWETVGKMDTVSAWGAVLNACKEWGNVELGELAAKRALELDPGNVGIYVGLSNLYAGAGMWDEIGEVRELMKGRGLKKDVGFSWIEKTLT